MTKPSSTTEMFAGQSQDVTVTSKDGKKIVLRKPPMLFMAMQRLRMALGAEYANNEALVNGYMPLLYITAIGEDEIITLNSQIQINSVCEQLGDDGMIAVITGLQKHFNEANAADKDTIKK